MSGLFDIQVKKQQNTWATRKQWIRGTDGDLLGECYAIYQKWGLSNLAVGVAAMEHVFGLDPKKRSFVVQAAQQVEEVRKLLMKGEAESRAVVQSGERPTITTEMVFARVKETQELESAQALDKLQAYEAELNKEMAANPIDQGKLGQVQGFVVAARQRLNESREALMKGQGGYTDANFKEAVAALTPNVTNLVKMLEDTNRKQVQVPPGMTAATEGKIDTKEAMERVKAIWSKLLRAVILQNTDRGQGEVVFEVTENSKESVQHLRALVSNEVAAVSAVAKGKGESFVSFTNRLQEKERFLGWMASVFTGSAGTTEQESVMEYAAGVLFETLKKVLPQANMWMALNSQQRGTGSGSSFNRLSAIMIEVYGKGGEEEQPEQPKHVAMVGLKGGLSRKQGTKVESEEKTEEHNKKVVTRYRPGDALEVEGEDQNSEDEGAGELPRVSFVKRGTKSPAKGQNRDGRAAWVGESTDRGDTEEEQDKMAAAFEVMQDRLEAINASTALLLERVQASNALLLRGGGDFSSSRRRRPDESPPRNYREQAVELCRDYSRGACRFGTSCRFEHRASDRSPREAQKRSREEQRCTRAMDTGACNIRGCDLFHGKWNKNTNERCQGVITGQGCRYQWSEEGCRFLHA